MKKIKIKRREVQVMLNACNRLDRVQETKFAYAIAKNKQLLTREMDVIKEANKVSDDYKEYDRKRLALVHEHAARDEEGNPVMADSVNIKVRNRMEFNAALENLQEEHREALDAANAQADKFEEFMEEEWEYEGYAIRAELVPEDLSSDELLGIMDLIEGELEL